jgi:hypothetical protein
LAGDAFDLGDLFDAMPTGRPAVVAEVVVPG